jgi:hypothetical protein
MARTPAGEVLSAIGDALGKPVRRGTAARADPFSYASYMQEPVKQVIEEQLKAFGTQTGGKISRSNFSPGTVGGKGGLLIQNRRWRFSSGFKPGFTVVLRHQKQNILQMQLVGRPTFPMAWVVALILGAALELLWFPWISTNFFRIWSLPLIGPLYIVAIVVSTFLVYWLVVKVTNIIFISLIVLGLCGVASVALSYFWGFIFGSMIGWTLITRAYSSCSARHVKEGLAVAMTNAASVVANMAPPAVVSPAYAYGPGYVAPPFYAPAPAMGPAPQQMPMANYYAPQPYMAPARTPGYHPPPPAAPSGHPCPTCRGPIAMGAPFCPACQTPLNWG